MNFIKLTKKLMIMLLMILMLLMKIKNKFKLNKYKNSFWNIECGFNNFMFKSFKISMNFILIMMIFIIFDMEMSMLIPIIMNFINKIKKFNIIYLIMLMMLIFYSMIYEIKFKSIMWNY